MIICPFILARGRDIWTHNHPTLKYVRLFMGDNWVLSTGLIMWIGHRKEIKRKEKADVSSVSPSSERRANARNFSFRISLRWPIHIINPVDKTQLSGYTSHRRSTTVSLETYPSFHGRVLEDGSDRIMQSKIAFLALNAWIFRPFCNSIFEFQEFS